MFLWLSNGQIQKRKGRLGEPRKHNLNLLVCQILIHNIRHYLGPCQWDMFLLIMDMDTRSVLLLTIFQETFELLQCLENVLV